MSRYYSITIRIISVITLIAFGATQAAFGYPEGREKIGTVPNKPSDGGGDCPYFFHLRSQQAATEGNSVGDEIANSLGAPVKITTVSGPDKRNEKRSESISPAAAPADGASRGDASANMAGKNKDVNGRAYVLGGPSQTTNQKRWQQWLIRLQMAFYSSLGRMVKPIVTIIIRVITDRTLKGKPSLIKTSPIRIAMALPLKISISAVPKAFLRVLVKYASAITESVTCILHFVNSILAPEIALEVLFNSAGVVVGGVPVSYGAAAPASGASRGNAGGDMKGATARAEGGNGSVHIPISLYRERLEQLKQQVQAKQGEFRAEATSLEERLDMERALNRMSQLVEAAEVLLNSFPNNTELLDIYINGLAIPLLAHPARTVNLILASRLSDFLRAIRFGFFKQPLELFTLKNVLDMGIRRKSHWKEASGYFYLPGLPIILEAADSELFCENLIDAARLIRESEWLDVASGSLKETESVILGTGIGALGHASGPGNCIKIEYEGLSVKEAACILVHEDRHITDKHSQRMKAIEKFERDNFMFEEDETYKGVIEAIAQKIGIDFNRWFGGESFYYPSNILEELQAYGVSVQFLHHIWNRMGFSLKEDYALFYERIILDWNYVHRLLRFLRETGEVNLPSGAKFLCQEAEEYLEELDVLWQNIYLKNLTLVEEVNELIRRQRLEQEPTYNSADWEKVCVENETYIRNFLLRPVKRWSKKSIKQLMEFIDGLDGVYVSSKCLESLVDLWFAIYARIPLDAEKIKPKWHKEGIMGILAAEMRASQVHYSTVALHKSLEKFFRKNSRLLSYLPNSLHDCFVKRFEQKKRQWSMDKDPIELLKTGQMISPLLDYAHLKSLLTRSKETELRLDVLSLGEPHMSIISSWLTSETGCNLPLVSSLIRYCVVNGHTHPPPTFSSPQDYPEPSEVDTKGAKFFAEYNIPYFILQIRKDGEFGICWFQDDIWHRATGDKEVAKVLTKLKFLRQENTTVTDADTKDAAGGHAAAPEPLTRPAPNGAGASFVSGASGAGIKDSANSGGIAGRLAAERMYRGAFKIFAIAAVFEQLRANQVAVITALEEAKKQNLDRYGIVINANNDVVAGLRKLEFKIIPARNKQEAESIKDSLPAESFIVIINENGLKILYDKLPADFQPIILDANFVNLLQSA